MPLFVQPRLVNEPSADSGLLLDFHFGGRALLFDLGDLGSLSAREVLRVDHVFVSHRHMDHFAGFDRLLRLNLYQERIVHLVGPPGLCAGVEAKLGAYSWNLLGAHSADFALLAADWSEDGFGDCALFRARDAFRRTAAEPPCLAAGLLHEEADFFVEGAVLDHGIPCLAFAFQERIRVNVHKPALDRLGLPVGPWLTDAKRAVRRGDPPETPLQWPDGDDPIALGALLEAGALQTGRGQRVVYLTDMADSEANVARAVGLAAGADQLFIEAGFLDEDRALAAAKYHLTAAQAGRIARAANVARAVPHHFSARYLERPAVLREEFERAFAGETP